MLSWCVGLCVTDWKLDRVMAACCFIQIKVFSIKAINTESYSGVMGNAKYELQGMARIIRRWKESFAALKMNGFRKVVMVILSMRYVI